MKTLYDIVSKNKSIRTDDQGVECAAWKLSMGDYIKSMRIIYNQLKLIFDNDNLRVALGMRAVNEAFERTKGYFDNKFNFKLAYYIIYFDRDDLYNAEKEFFGYIRIELLKLCDKRDEKVAINKFCLNQFTPTFKRICQ